MLVYGSKMEVTDSANKFAEIYFPSTFIEIIDESLNSFNMINTFWPEGVKNATEGKAAFSDNPILIDPGFTNFAAWAMM